MYKKKIIIIGTGWYGCHLALAFKKKGFQVKVYEKNQEIFSEASLYNQNRLHLGFHYPRSHITRVQSKKGYKLFNSCYPSLTRNLDISLYAISKNFSLMDFETYKAIMRSTGLIFEDFSDNNSCFLFKNLEGIINTGEKVIDSFKAKKLFEKELYNILVKGEEIKENHIKSFIKDGYSVIDCTWNKIFPNNSLYYESAILFKYKNKSNKSFGLTIMDGNFSSIFPIDKEFSSLSDVKLTPFFKTSSIVEAYKSLNNIKNLQINTIREKMEFRICEYLPNFHDYFEYKEPIFSIKTKRADNNSADRSTQLIKIDQNVFSVFSGKIDTIFEVESQLLSIFSN